MIRIIGVLCQPADGILERGEIACRIVCVPNDPTTRISDGGESSTGVVAKGESAARRVSHQNKMAVCIVGQHLGSAIAISDLAQFSLGRKRELELILPCQCEGAIRVLDKNIMEARVHRS